ncbi:hypothetical protein JW777_01705, partial [bacterium]|nr:hypothetical protein [bacterium]
GRAAEAVARVLRRYAPLVESGNRGRFYADLSGTGRLFGGIRDAASRILRDVSDSVRFEGTAGLASNKLVSGVAAAVIRSCGDLCEVPAGSEAPFLAPLAVRLLPAVRKAEGPLLAEFNIRLVEQLAGIPLPQLVRVFGRFGFLLHKQALGIDEAPVRPPEVKPFVLEEETLAADTNDDAVLLSVLRLLAERACSRMRAKNVFARTAWLFIRYSSGMDAVRRVRINCPAGLGRILFRSIGPAFLKANRSRQAVRYLSLTLTDLAPSGVQLRLFEETPELDREERLACAMEALRGKYGFSSVGFGVQGI